MGGISIKGTQRHTEVREGSASKVQNRTQGYGRDQHQRYRTRGREGLSLHHRHKRWCWFLKSQKPKHSYAPRVTLLLCLKATQTHSTTVPHVTHRFLFKFTQSQEPEIRDQGQQQSMILLEGRTTHQHTVCGAVIYTHTLYTNRAFWWTAVHQGMCKGPFTLQVIFSLP